MSCALGDDACFCDWISPRLCTFWTPDWQPPADDRERDSANTDLSSGGQVGPGNTSNPIDEQQHPIPTKGEEP